MTRSRRIDASLRTRVRIGFLAASVVGLLGLVFVVATFGAVLDARERLADRLDPAGAAVRSWMASVADQESGVRGYALSGEDEFLGPYEAGEEEAGSAEARARMLLRDEPGLLEPVERFAAAVDTWHEEVAAPLVESIEAGGVGAVDEVALRRSKKVFDDLRAAFERLQSSVEERRAEARRSLDRHTTDLVYATVGAMAAIVVGFGLAWIALNRWVVGPLGRLGADARRVAGGDLDHPVEPTGPADLARLGQDMEAMRRRILDELAAVEEANRVLDEQAEDLTRSNRELEQFAYVASHDLQEPLRKITGFCQLLQRRYGGELDERADEYIGFAVDGAKRMQRLINDLLAFSRVGRSTSSFGPVDLAAVARSAASALDEQVRDAGAALEVGDLPTVSGDAGLLELLVQNLIANAVKFGGEDPPIVRLGAERVAGGWELWCADDGIGIEPAYRERVFVIFQRLHDRDAYDGTGIGLALCRKIVEFHGGRIWIDPVPRRGTTVRWTLPDRPADNGAVLGQAGAPLPPSEERT